MTPYCTIPNCDNFREGSTPYCASHGHEFRKAERIASKEPKAFKPIPKRTAKRAAQEARYLKRRAEWLAEHNKCEYAFCMKKSVDLHHMAGREGLMLLNEDYWLALCRDHHKTVTRDSAQAIKDGYSISRNQKTEI